MKNEYTLVIPPGYTREEYLGLKDAKVPEAEHESFWDKKVKVDPVTGTLFMIFSEIFIGMIKVFLFFLEAYPKAREEVRREEAEKRAPYKK